MDFNQLPMLLMAAFGLGLLHSLDADHIMAVTNLASGNSASRSSIRFCLRWAIGHSLVLILIGSLVFLLGMQIPFELSHYAELMVSIVLMAIGFLVLFSLYRQRAHIHFHQHDDMPLHAHWHSHKKRSGHEHKHTAVLVGMLHGMAGSAPLLALIPIAINKQPLYGFIYLLIFSLGVILAMLIFGGLLSYFSSRLISYSEKIFHWLRAGLGLGAISIGGLIMAGSF